MSGGGRRAGLERRASGVQVSEFGVGREVQEFDRLRQQEQRRCRTQRIAGERNDGTDRASIGRLLVGVRAGGLLPRLVCRFGCSAALRIGVIDLDQTGLNRRSGPRAKRMEMPERQRKLDDKREQCEARTSFDVSSEPLHAGRALSLGAAQASRPAPMLYYNIET